MVLSGPIVKKSENVTCRYIRKTFVGLRLGEPELRAVELCEDIKNVIDTVNQKHLIEFDVLDNTTVSFLPTTMKLQGETTPALRESKRTTFFNALRKQRMPENGGLADSEEPTCDKGLIGRILRKVGGLGHGESAFFATTSYSPQRRSKSQERAPVQFQIRPFTEKPTRAPVLKTYKNLSSVVPTKTVDYSDTRRCSHPNLPSHQTQKPANHAIEPTPKDNWKNFRQSDTNLVKPNLKAINFNKDRSENDTSNDQVPKTLKEIQINGLSQKVLKPQNTGLPNHDKPKDSQLQPSNEPILSAQSGPSMKIDLPGHSESSGEDNFKENVKTSNAGVGNGVTRIQIKYNGPEATWKESPTDGTTLTDDKRTFKVNGKDEFRTVENSQSSVDKVSPSLEVMAINLTNEKVNSSSWSPPITTSHPLQVPPWLQQQSSSSSSSKSRPGRITIRPASNLAASRTRAEFLRLTDFNDIKTGEFAMPVKPKKQKRDEETDFDFDREAGIKNEDHGESITDIDFIGAGVVQGKSMLAKTKSNKMSVIFSEEPVVHLIERTYSSTSGESEGPDDYKANLHSSFGSSSDLFSSLTNATTKGGLSSYKSKTLTDFEFDFDNPPLPIPTTQTSQTGIDKTQGQIYRASNQPSEALLWSSSGTMDLLF